MAISQNFPTVRPTLNLNFARSKTLDPRITFERNSIGTYVNEDGLIKTAGVNEARFDHDPDTGESLGLLIEQSRTNKVRKSENFASSSTYWRTQDGSVTSLSSVTSPDGVSNMWLIDLSAQSGTASSGSRVYQSGLAFNNVVNTFSFYARSVSGSGTFPVAYYNGSDYIKSYVELTETTQRYYISCPAGISTTGSNIFGFTRRGTTHNETLTQAYVWGAQAEVGSFPTSYIQTSESEVTREADEATITGTNFTDWYNASEGSIFAKYSAGTNSSESPFGFTKTGSENTDVIAIGASSSGPIPGVVPTIVVRDGDVPQTGVSVPIYPVDGDVIRTAIGYKENDFAIYSATDTASGFVLDSSGTIPTVDIARIGKYPYYGIWQNRPIAKILYYPKRLSNAQLQNLTK